jgi:hypothetical protein
MPGQFTGRESRRSERGGVNWEGLWEFTYPYLLAAFAVWAAWWSGFDATPKIEALIPAVLNGSAIAAGFLFTTKTLLLAMDEKWVIQRSKEAGYYLRFVHFLIQAVWLCLITACLSAVAAMADTASPHFRWIFHIWVFVVAATGLATVRVLRILSAILRAVAREG